MKILKVVHGYPMRYNAGSEVYSQTLCHALADRHEVHVFTREEDPFTPDFNLRVEQDVEDPRVSLHLVNNPRLKDRYRAEGIDRRFAEVIERVKPDLVHVEHLNHLSTSLPREAFIRKIPIIYTLHDYWLMCPRGQFMQMFPEDADNLWAACDGQEDRKCAERCYARYFSGAPDETESDIAYWTDWVRRRMRHVREMSERVDLFIAPSRYLHDLHRDRFGIPARKLVYLDYGFSIDRMKGRTRKSGETFTFGYIGTHIPAKGIHDLLQAFGQLHGDAILRIWGRPNGQVTAALRARALSLPHGCAGRVEWLPEYENKEIVRDVFDRCDAIVVPSVWAENSPLVIHEAQQARVPVITANIGGMMEYVQHETNGLLFEHRSVISLAEQMQRLVNDHALAAKLGSRGYLLSNTGDIPDIESHVREVESLYRQVIRPAEAAGLPHHAGPRRITFDTNPDTCNLKCMMCEEHSPYSRKQAERTACGHPPRRMDIRVLEQVLDELKDSPPREIIPSTMGEPLLYKHFDRIVELCQLYGIRLNLTTNGTFPQRGVREWAALILPVGSDVKISINGATAGTQESIMRNTLLDTIVENIRLFVRIRDEFAASGGNYCSVTMQVTFMEKNLAEFPDLIRLAADLNVDRVKGHHLWVHFDAMREQDLRRSTESVARWNQIVSQCHAVAANHPRSNGKSVKLEHFTPLDFQQNTAVVVDSECPFLGKEAWVNHAGRFDPCCSPDELRQSLGYFGMVQQDGFLNIWNGPAHRALVKNYQDRPLCRSCLMRKPADRKSS